MLFSKTVVSLSIIPVIFLAGCSSYQPPELTPIFHTNIQADNSKMFTLTLLGRNGIAGDSKNRQGEAKQDKPEGDKGTRKGKGGKAEGGKNGGKGGGRGEREGRNSQAGGTQVSSRSGQDPELIKQLEAHVYQMLEQQLVDNQYCRDGYFELEKSLNRGVIVVKGECIESATEQDRVRFENK
ncbi:hypothetical protein [Thalassotalea sp. PLHSN55]|uniref:hypothetical protein n=1 Tax=Thalassotalea sp. PLHSN55 TaxID=3435888 RepID=UPI003F8725B4